MPGNTVPVRLDRLPLTYDECRARFRRAVGDAGLTGTVEPISARGPEHQDLSIDVAMLGSPTPRRALVVLSGVHGVEGFVGSALQCDFVTEFDRASLPDDTGVVLLHAVNPWGMAWGRRQNESNVDLNRNWCRDCEAVVHNDAYDALHRLACPDDSEMPAVESLLAAAMDLVAEHGLEWVRNGITSGQYRHPDGLHFGGDRTEESTAIVERVVPELLGCAERVLAIDLHTGHGPWGEVTFLSDAPPGSAQDVFLRDHVGAERVEATVDNAAATTGLKAGQIANGFAALLPDALCHSSSVEFGTATDEAQLVATYLEHWVYRHGDRGDARHAAAIDAYRACFTPDDPAWERRRHERRPPIPQRCGACRVHLDGVARTLTERAPENHNGTAPWGRSRS